MLPQYSGGLGILAGDHLKAASDLGVPIIGVGLLYRHGYFRQSLSRDGWQQETLPGPRPRRAAALAAARGRRLGRARSTVGLPGGATARRPHLGRPGRPGAAAAARLRRRGEQRGRSATSPTGCTAATPSTGCARRCCSASAASAPSAPTAGITGAPAPEVFHTNEGHAGFLGLERIRELDRGPRASTSTTALEVVPRRHRVHHPHPGAGRHRPVPARPDRAVLRRRQRLPPASRSSGSSALGAEDYEGGDPAVFNMAVMGLRLAQRANGVSQLHGAVSRGHVRRAVAGVRRRRAARSPRSPTACTRRPGWRREIFELAREQGVRPTPGRTPTRRDGLRRRRQGPRRADLGDQAAAARAARRGRPHAGCASSWLQRGAAPAELGWID